MTDTIERKPPSWRRTILTIAAVLLYMIALFWLWHRTGFPDRLGVHVAARGRAGLVEHWWYSYLLIEHPDPWDLTLFAYMWAPVAAFVAKLGWRLLRNRPQRS